MSGFFQKLSVACFMDSKTNYNNFLLKSRYLTQTFTLKWTIIGMNDQKWSKNHTELSRLCTRNDYEISVTVHVADLNWRPQRKPLNSDIRCQSQTNCQIWSFILWGCFAAIIIGSLHKVDFNNNVTGLLPNPTTSAYSNSDDWKLGTGIFCKTVIPKTTKLVFVSGKADLGQLLRISDCSWNKQEACQFKSTLSVTQLYQSHSGERFYGQRKPQWSCSTTIMRFMFGGDFQTVPNVKRGGRSIMLWACFAVIQLGPKGQWSQTHIKLILEYTK